MDQAIAVEESLNRESVDEPAAPVQAARSRALSCQCRTTSTAAREATLDVEQERHHKLFRI